MTERLVLPPPPSYASALGLSVASCGLGYALRRMDRGTLPPPCPAAASLARALAAAANAALGLGSLPTVRGRGASRKRDDCLLVLLQAVQMLWAISGDAVC